MDRAADVRLFSAVVVIRNETSRRLVRGGLMGIAQRSVNKLRRGVSRKKGSRTTAAAGATGDASWTVVSRVRENRRRHASTIGVGHGQQDEDSDRDDNDMRGRSDSSSVSSESTSREDAFFGIDFGDSGDKEALQVAMELEDELDADDKELDMQLAKERNTSIADDLEDEVDIEQQRTKRTNGKRKDNGDESRGKNETNSKSKSPSSMSFDLEPRVDNDDDFLGIEPCALGSWYRHPPAYVEPHSVVKFGTVGQVGTGAHVLYACQDAPYLGQFLFQWQCGGRNDGGAGNRASCTAAASYAVGKREGGTDTTIEIEFVIHSVDDGEGGGPGNVGHVDEFVALGTHGVSPSRASSSSSAAATARRAAPSSSSSSSSSSRRAQGNTTASAIMDQKWERKLRERSRSVLVVINNCTNLDFELQREQLFAGEWGKNAPTIMPAQSVTRFGTMSDSFFEGTRASAFFNQVGGFEPHFNVMWANPFVGSNTFDLATPSASILKLSKYINDGKHAEFVVDVSLKEQQVQSRPTFGEELHVLAAHYGKNLVMPPLLRQAVQELETRLLAFEQRVADLVAAEIAERERRAKRRRIVQSAGMPSLVVDDDTLLEPISTDDTTAVTHDHHAEHSTKKPKKPKKKKKKKKKATKASESSSSSSESSSSSVTFSTSSLSASNGKKKHKHRLHKTKRRQRAAPSSIAALEHEGKDALTRHFNHATNVSNSPSAKLKSSAAAQEASTVGATTSGAARRATRDDVEANNRADWLPRGLFSTPGAVREVQELKRAMERNDQSMKLSRFGSHSLAHVLKVFLLELPHAVLPRQRLDEFAQLTNDDGHGAARVVQRLQAFVDEMPAENRAVMRQVCQLLSTVAALSTNENDYDGDGDNDGVVDGGKREKPNRQRRKIVSDIERRATKERKLLPNADELGMLFGPLLAGAVEEQKTLKQRRAFCHTLTIYVEKFHFLTWGNDEASE